MFNAATPVEPEPIQLSSITSPSCVYVLIKYSSKSTGFWVGCVNVLELWEELLKLIVLRKILNWYFISLKKF